MLASGAWRPGGRADPPGTAARARRERRTAAVLCVSGAAGGVVSDAEYVRCAACPDSASGRDSPALCPAGVGGPPGRYPDT